MKKVLTVLLYISALATVTASFIMPLKDNNKIDNKKQENLIIAMETNKSKAQDNRLKVLDFYIDIGGNLDNVLDKDVYVNTEKYMYDVLLPHDAINEYTSEKLNNKSYNLFSVNDIAYENYFFDFETQETTQYIVLYGEKETILTIECIWKNGLIVGGVSSYYSKTGGVPDLTIEEEDIIDYGNGN